MKIAIVGSRDYRSQGNVADFVGGLPEDAIIVSGGARGVDSWAVEFAGTRLTEVYPADWDKWGRSAGFRRNQTIVDACDELYAFWDGLSKGTLDSIQRAARAGKLKGIFV